MRTVIGVAGGSCSGKTTLARLLAARLPAGTGALLSFDSYYRDLSHLPMEARGATNFDHPDILDDALFLEHLDRLVAGESVPSPQYDFTHHVRAAARVIEPPRVLVVEGILLLHWPAIRARLDRAVFLDAAPALRLTRRIARDVAERGRTEASVRAQFATTVQPMHEAFVQPTARHAHEVIDGEADLVEEADRLIAWALAR